MVRLGLFLIFRAPNRYHTYNPLRVIIVDNAKNR
jgi:hypothetical protein